MFELIDTHAHVYLPKFQDDLDQTISNARAVGVGKIFMPNIDTTTIDAMLQLEKDYPDYCVPMMGLHPCYVKADYKEQLKVIKDWWGKRQFCAVGEVGVDLYWDKSFRKEQIEAFKLQINWARDLKKPVVIHCRESMDLCIEIVRDHQVGDLRGVFHCFTGDAEQARRIIDMNFLVGIGGVLTFKNGGLDAVLPDIDLQYIVLETDSPYLAPVPFRGKRNEPSYTKHILEKMEVLLDLPREEIAEITTSTAKRLFDNE